MNIGRALDGNALRIQSILSIFKPQIILANLFSAQYGMSMRTYRAHHRTTEG